MGAEFVSVIEYRLTATVRWSWTLGTTYMWIIMLFWGYFNDHCISIVLLYFNDIIVSEICIPIISVHFNDIIVFQENQCRLFQLYRYISMVFTQTNKAKAYFVVCNVVLKYEIFYLFVCEFSAWICLLVFDVNNVNYVFK